MIDSYGDEMRFFLIFQYHKSRASVYTEVRDFFFKRFIDRRSGFDGNYCARCTTVYFIKFGASKIINIFFFLFIFKIGIGNKNNRRE